MLTELTIKKEAERLLKLDHQRNQEKHHGEMMIELIKSVTDKVARSNQEDLEVERANQINIMKQILEGVKKN